MKSPPMGYHVPQSVKPPDHRVPDSHQTLLVIHCLAVLRRKHNALSRPVSFHTLPMNAYHFQVFITASQSVSLYLLPLKSDPSNLVCMCVYVHVCMHLFSENNTVGKTLTN